jgi:hypothetical protein
VNEEVKVSNSYFRKAKLSLLVSVPAVFATVYLYPIANSGLSGDDIPNSMRSAALTANDWTRWEFIKLSIIQWKNNEGRFFPVSTIENVFMFDLIHSVAIFKLLQLFITVALLVLAATFIAKVVGSTRLFPLALFLLLSCIQTRNWYDPTLGFGLLLQSVQIKILACLCALYYALQGKDNRWLLCLGGSITLWLASLLQYEVVITLFPTLVIMIILLPSNRFHKLVALAAVSLPTVIYVLYIINLRAGITASAAYSIKPDLGLTFVTYLKQLSGAIPFSAVIWSRGGGSLLVTLSEVPLLHLFLLTATVCLAVTFRLRLAELSSRRVLLVFIIGLNFVLGPNIPTALSSRWQNEVAWGLSYLSVSFTYTGVALIAFSVLFVISRWTINRSVLSNAAFCLFLAFFSLSAVSNHGLLDDNAKATKFARHQRDLYELAVREGFLSHVPNGSVIVYSSFDENSWINDYFTNWLGGPEKLVFIRSAEDLQTKCNPNVLFERCTRTFRLDYLPTTTSSLVLSLVELDARKRDSQLAQRYFATNLSPLDLLNLCPGPVKEKTKSGAMYFCRED